MNLDKYNQYILPGIQELLREHPELTFIQDNAPSHRSQKTTRNLQRRRIRYKKWPPYSPDLNLIEHVWDWMKDYIETHYFKTRYDPMKISLEELRRIIWEAWEAVPESFIESLVDSWWRRCQAVIDAHGGPTKY